MNLSVKEASRLLSVSEKTIYRWIKQEIIPAYKIHEQYKFNRAELVEWATSRRIGAPQESFLAPSEKTAPRINLAEALEAGGIFYRTGGTDRDQVLAEVVHHLRLPEEVDRNTLLKILIARENLCSTGIGNGIALPHLRNPGLLPMTRPTITLSFLEHKVDFQAIDNRPVDILCTILTPDLPSHLCLLSRLGFVLRNTKFRKLLDPPGSREEILTTLRQTEALLTH